ncbi:MAG: hypothetical protein E7675_05205 [Ruminococcaceae bacterium]|nr:hypothetical protein [Oscillospiraceae bacterium]
MKTSSIIFIIIGLCAMVAGMILCSSADAQARADGYNLHEGLYDAQGNITESFSFSLEDNVNVSKISIELEGVEVIVLGGSSKSEIVCQNLYGGTYACYVSNKVITITNTLDSSNILEALSSIKFDGIRNFFDPQVFEKRQSRVYIYVNEDSEVIKQLSLKVKNCDVNVKNVTGSLDFRLDAEDCNVNFSDCATDSSVYCNIKKSTLAFNNFEFNRSEFILEESTFNFDSTLILLYRFDITSDKTITVNDNLYEGYFNLYNEFESYPLVKITGTSSDINVKFLG